MERKKLYVLLCGMLLLVNLFSYAQAPESISYQAIVRDSENKLSANKSVGVRIAISVGQDNVIYTETHSVTTNNNGLLSLEIGKGTVVSGVFSSINWASGTYFVKTEIDLEGGKNYSISSTTQLLSVPYALHAKTAQKLSLPVSFNDLIDVPANEKFSGSYNDLTDQPTLFDGKYSSLEGLPTLFDGDYKKLTNLPTLFDGKYSSLKEAPELFSGDYKDLSNKPSFPDSIKKHGFSGKYSDLIDAPTGSFTGVYGDLLGKPVFKDSVVKYNSSLDYNVLKNRPTLFSGSYDALDDKPSFSDSIMVYGFSGDYFALTNRPNIKDSISAFGFTTNYNKLENKPNIKDSINIYGFKGNYEDLTNIPNWQDSITKHKFSGSYRDLTDVPIVNVKDTVDKYNFSGKYEDLKGRPEGKASGDILYWDGTSNWNTLSLGNEGQILSIQNGVLTWIDNVVAKAYKAGEIFLNNEGKPAGIVVEISAAGDQGKVISLDEFDAAWDPLATTAAQAAGFSGTLPTATGANSMSDGKWNTDEIRRISGFEMKYPAIKAVANLGDDWYLPSADELKTLIYDKRNTINPVLENMGKTKLQEANYWSSTEKDAFYAKQVAFKGYAFGGKNVLAGDVVDTLKATTGKIRAMRYLTAEEINSRPIDYKIYKIGDVYYENNKAVGIVYEIQDGGFHGKVVSIIEGWTFWCDIDLVKDVLGASSTTDGAANTAAVLEYTEGKDDIYYFKDFGISWPESELGDGWYLPASKELKDIYDKVDIINDAIRNLTRVDGATELNTATEELYWSSTEKDAGNAIGLSFQTGVEKEEIKSENGLMRGVKLF